MNGCSFNGQDRVVCKDVFLMKNRHFVILCKNIWGLRMECQEGGCNRSNIVWMVQVLSIRIAPLSLWVLPYYIVGKVPSFAGFKITFLKGSQWFITFCCWLIGPKTKLLTWLLSGLDFKKYMFHFLAVVRSFCLRDVLMLQSFGSFWWSFPLLFPSACVISPLA